jgi:hypothetical protein
MKPETELSTIEDCMSKLSALLPSIGEYTDPGMHLRNAIDDMYRATRCLVREMKGPLYEDMHGLPAWLDRPIRRKVRHRD